jgi:hypothetical protein
MLSDNAFSQIHLSQELPDDINIMDPFAVTFHSIIIFGAEGNLALKKTSVILFFPFHFLKI